MVMVVGCGAEAAETALAGGGGDLVNVVRKGGCETFEIRFDGGKGSPSADRNSSAPRGTTRPPKYVASPRTLISRRRSSIGFFRLGRRARNERMKKSAGKQAVIRSAFNNYTAQRGVSVSDSTLIVNNI